MKIGNSSSERVEEFKYFGTTLTIKILFRKKLRAERSQRIFGPKRDEVTVEWRKLHNEELNDLYCTPNIIRAIKSKIKKWVGM
jgi:hypothetical protein